MKKILTLLLLCVTCFANSQDLDFGIGTKIHITTNIPDAIIKANGQQVATGSANVGIQKGDKCVTVEVGKPGYLTQSMDFCKGDGHKKDYSFTLAKDEAYYVSTQNANANTDQEVIVRQGLTMDQAWKTLNQIILNKFDVIESSDKENGYLRTGYNKIPFDNRIIRTRIIVKLYTESPLAYKIKLVSEYTDVDPSNPNRESYQLWNRVLNSYQDLMGEIQTRLGAK